MPGYPRRPKTIGCDLDDGKAKSLFDNHIPNASCHPKQLWHLNKITTDTRTSDWRACVKALPFLSAVLDVTQGRIPKQYKWRIQFQSWLEDQEQKWRFKDSDEAISRVRCMLQSLLARQGDGAPKQHPQLQILLDKMIIDVLEPADVTIVPVTKKEIPVLMLEDASDSDIDKYFRKPVDSKPKIQVIASSANTRPLKAIKFEMPDIFQDFRSHTNDRKSFTQFLSMIAAKFKSLPQFLSLITAQFKSLPQFVSMITAQFKSLTQLLEISVLFKSLTQFLSKIKSIHQSSQQPSSQN